MKIYRNETFKITSWNQNEINWNTFAETERLT